MKQLLFIAITVAFTSCEVCEDCTTKTTWDYPGTSNDYVSTSVQEVCGTKNIRNAENPVKTTIEQGNVTITVTTTTNCL